MKRAKWFLFTLVTAMIFSLCLCACSQREESPENNITQENDSSSVQLPKKPALVDPSEGGDILTITPNLVFSYMEATDSYMVGTDSDSNGNAYAGNEVDIVIPSTYDDGTHGEKNVTAIGKRAFSNRVNIQSVHIPETVTKLSSYSFNNCTGLTEITVPESVTEIESFTFYACSSLSDITLPFVGGFRTSTNVNSAVFGYIFGFAPIASDKTTNQIYHSNNANSNFFIPESIKNVTITDATHLSYGAFYGCGNIETLAINAEVVTMGSHSLFGCTGLKKLTIPFIGENRQAKDSSNAVFGYVFGSRDSAVSDVTIQYYNATNSLKYYFIPSSITEVTVLDEVLVNYGAFYGCKYIQKITLNEGITNIDVNAFRDCSVLEEVTIPSTVKHIGHSAFSNTSVYLTAAREPITYIDGWVIDHTGNLTNATLANGTVGIADNAFTNNLEISSLSLPASVKHIGENAFSGVKGIINADDCSFETLALFSFADSGLTSLTLSDNCTEIGESAFQNCGGLTAPVVIPASVKDINERAFYGISVNITFAEGSALDSLGAYSFYESKLKELPLSDNCTTIPAYALYNCKDISSSVSLPSSVVSVEEYAFSGVTAELSMLGGGLEIIGNNAFFEGNVSSIFIANTCTAISDYAFYGCTLPADLTLPASIKRIGKSAFENTTCAINFAEGSAIDRIDASAFRNSKLVSINISENCTEIPSYAFADCSELASLTIPSSVLSVGTGILYNCSALESLSLPFVGASRIDNNSPSAVLGYVFSYSVIAGEGKTYQCYTEGSDGSGNLYRLGYYYYIPSSLKQVFVTDATALPYGAFYNCNGIETLSLNDGIREIGDYALYNCSELTSISFSSSIKNIGKYAFKNAGCSFSLGEEGYSIDSISEGSFDTSRITAINLSHNITAIPENAFANSSMRNITIPNTVESIERNAFSNCISLSGVTFEQNSVLTTVGTAAFYKCNNLLTILLPASTHTVLSSAFYDVSGTILFEEGATIRELGIYAFAGSGLLSIKMSYDISSYLLKYISTDKLMNETEMLATTFSGCSNLNTVIVDFDSPEGKWTPDIFPSNPAIFVPQDRISYFTSAEGWGAYSENIFDITDVELSSNYVISSDGRTFVRYLGDSDVYAVPENSLVSIIGSYAFSGNDNLKEIIIPPTVRILSSYAFYGCTNLEKVSFLAEGGLTEIYSNAFYGCDKLVSFDLSANPNLINIYESAFFGCTSIESLFIPRRVNMIGAYAFSGISASLLFDPNSSLSTIANYTFSNYLGNALQLPKSVTSIGGYAFTNSLASISFEEGSLLTSIGSYAFSDYKGTSITLPNGGLLKSIAGFAFNNCTTLETLVIPSCVTSIAPSALRGCSALESLSVPFVGANVASSDSPSALFGYIFGYSQTSETGTIAQTYSTSDLTKTIHCYIPATLTDVSITAATKIPTGAFQNMANLSSVFLNEGITTIADKAFSGCSSIYDISLPSTLLSVGRDVFLLSGLAENAIDGIIYADGWVFGTNTSTLITSVTLPVGTTGIANYALKGCADLISFTFNDELLYIGDHAFENCSNASFSTLILPATLQKIGRYAFINCKANVSFAEGSVISVIPEDSFAYYKGTSIVLPSSITEVEGYAFRNATLLESVTLPINLVSIGKGAFYGCFALKTMSLPFVGESATANKTASSVFGFIFDYIPTNPLSENTIIQYYEEQSSCSYFVPSTLEQVTITNASFIPFGAFGNLPSSCKVVLNDEISSIFPYAFDSYTPSDGIDELILPTGLFSIGEYAFRNSTAKITFPATIALNEINTRAFASYLYDGDVTIPDSIINIRSGAFDGANNLTSVSLPSDLETIESSALRGLSSVSTMTVPSSVVSIGDYAFAFCTNLLSFTVSDASVLTTFGTDILRGCTELTSLTVPFIGKDRTDNLTITSVLGYFFGKSITEAEFGSSTSQQFSKSTGAKYSIPSTLTSVTLTDADFISYGCFSNCSNVKNIAYNSDVTAIYPYSFYNCSALEHLNGNASDAVGTFAIGNNVQSVGEFSLYGCSRITSLSLPFIGATITPSSLDIRQGLFGYIFGYGNGNATNSTKQYFGEGIYDFSYFYIPLSLSRITITNASVLPKYAFNSCARLSSITLNDELTDINEYAFAGISASVVISDSSELTTMGEFAFADYEGSTVNLPNGIEELSDNAFTSALELESINFKTVQRIGSYAFSDCTNLRNISLPSTVTEIGEGAFYGCSLISQLSLNATVVPTIGGTFGTSSSAIADTTRILVPVGYKESYRETETWLSYRTIVFEPNLSGDTFSLSTDGKRLDSYYGNDSSFTIPDGVEVIGEGAFQHNSSLNTITLSSSVTSIEAYSFADVKFLTTINVPSTVTSISPFAFYDTPLQTLSIPFVGSSVASAGTADGVLGTIFGYETTSATGLTPQKFGSELSDVAYYYIPSTLTSVTVSSSTVIPYGSFSNCSTLTTINFGASITTISTEAFINTTSLSKVNAPVGRSNTMVIPETVLSIEEGAFKGLSSIYNITLPFIGISASPTNPADGVFGAIFGKTQSGDSNVSTEQYYGNGVADKGFYIIPSSIVSVTLLDICTSIRDYAFNNCSKLTSVSFDTTVTSIGAYAFRNCTSIRNINLVDTETINASAFEGAAALRSVMIPNTVTEIKEKAFYNCSALASITFEETSTLNAIRTDAFGKLPSLISIVLPDSLTEISVGAISENNSLTTISLPFTGETINSRDTAQAIFGHIFGSSSTYISGYTQQKFGLSELDICYYNIPSTLQTVAITLDTTLPIGVFSGCSKLTAISLSNVSTIPEYAFYKCSSLEEGIVLPASTTTISEYAFAECTNLEITVPSSVDTISDYAFYKVELPILQEGLEIVSLGISSFAFTGLTDVTLADSCPLIPADAFAKCLSLTSITIPSSITEIGDHAFSGCTGLTRINSPDDGTFVIPNTVLSIGMGAIAKCNVTSLSVPYIGNTNISAGTSSGLFGYIFGAGTIGSATQQFYSADASFTYDIPDSLKTVMVTNASIIPYGAFYNCSSIETITISGSAIDTLSDYAFYNNSSLVTITIPETVSSIGDRTFALCGALTSLNSNTPSIFKLPAAVSNIGMLAFSGCQNARIEFEEGSSLTTISDNAFSSFLGSLITLPSSVTAIEASAFSGSTAEVDASLASISTITASSFRDYAGTRITIPTNVTEIGEYAFYGAASLVYLNTTSDEVINLPASLTAIRDNAFYGCSAIVSVLGDQTAVETIGNNAFENCSSIVSITLPSTLLSVGDKAFLNIADTISLAAGTGLNSIGAHAFNGSGLTSLSFGTSCTAILDYAFKDCHFSGPVVIPSTVKKVGPHAFENVSAELSFASESAIDLLGEYAFHNSGLTAITLSSSCTTLSAYSLSGTNLSTFTASALTSVEAYSLANNTQLLSVSFPSSVIQIKEFALYGCSSLSDLTIPFVGSDSFYAISYSDVLGFIFGSSTTQSTDFAVEQSYGFSLISSPRYYAIPASLRSVTLTNTTTIPYGGFYNCSNIETVSFSSSSSISTIEAYAFYNCLSLSTINSSTVGTADFIRSLSPEAPPKYMNLRSIATYAFGNCSSLTNVLIDAKTSTIESFAFYGCSSLISMQLPFIGATPLSTEENKVLGAIFGYTDYTAPNTIGQRYKENGELKYYYIPSSLKTVEIAKASTIPVGAFDKCSNLETIILPTDYTSIGQFAFNECGNLNDLIIPSSVSSIGRYAFASAMKATSNLSFNANSSLTALGEYSLYQLNAGTLTLPDNLISIGLAALARQSTPISGNLTEIVIPSRVTSIASGAFANNFAAKSGASVTTTISFAADSAITEIPTGAFASCGMTNIILPVSVTTLGNYAFNNCTYLSSIQFTASVSAIRSSCFAGCTSLTSVILPTSLSSIGVNAFSGLTSIELLATEPPTITDTNNATTTTLGGKGSSTAILPTTCVITIPTNSLEAYNENPIWATYTLIEKQ